MATTGLWMLAAVAAVLIATGLPAWIVLIVHIFGGWAEYPVYDIARGGNWYDFGFLVGAGSPFLGAANARKLSYPLNYWNALAAFAAIGVPLLIAVAAGKLPFGMLAGGTGATPTIAATRSGTVSQSFHPTIPAILWTINTERPIFPRSATSQSLTL